MGTMGLADFLPPALLRSPDMGPAQRWRLVGALYKQKLSLIEGSLALAALQLLCWFESGMAVFGAMCGLTLVLLALRLGSMAAFFRRSGRSAPEQWARLFVLGAAATGILWGATTVLTLLAIPYPPLHTIVLMCEAGWVAGAAVRNATSPATVMIQTVSTVLVAMVSALFTGIPIYAVTALFCLLMFTSIISVARYIGAQTEATLLSEQRLAEVNAQLTGTCAELERANARLEQLSATDALTGIGNRRAFDATLAAEWNRAVRDRTTMSLLVIDVDMFKAFNDFYGHPAGDACLRIIADTIESGLRRSVDFAGRFGGEEFVALLPGVDAEGAMQTAERLRNAVTDVTLEHARSPFGIVTVSIGAATAFPHAGCSALDLLSAADRALYRAKRAGRNCTEALPVLESTLDIAPTVTRAVFARAIAR